MPQLSPWEHFRPLNGGAPLGITPFSRSSAHISPGRNIDCPSFLLPIFLQYPPIQNSRIILVDLFHFLCRSFRSSSISSSYLITYVNCWFFVLFVSTHHHTSMAIPVTQRNHAIYLCGFIWYPFIIFVILFMPIMSSEHRVHPLQPPLEHYAIGPRDVHKHRTSAETRRVSTNHLTSPELTATMFGRLT